MNAVSNKKITGQMRQKLIRHNPHNICNKQTLQKLPNKNRPILV